MAWTPEQKAKAIADYLAQDPTPETSVEIIKEIAEEMDQSSNGVRMILVQAEVYVKKEPAAGTKTVAAPKDGAAPKRVSKEGAIGELVAALVASDIDADDEIISKLTGKAALYFAGVVKQLQAKAV